MLRKILLSLLKGLGPFVLIIVVIGLISWAYFSHELTYPSTADAVLYNSVVSISPRVSGTVNQVNVQQDQLVHQGDLLFSLDDHQAKLDLANAQNDLVLAQQNLAENQAALITAKANVASAQSAVNLQQSEFDRKQTLFKSGSLSPNDFDIAKQALLASQASLQVAQANLKSAMAALGTNPNQTPGIQKANLEIKQAQLNLSYTQITAPADGFLTNLNLTPGQTVTANNVLFGITTQKDWRVHAEILETFLRHIRVGQPVSLRLRMYPNTQYQGVVSGIGYGINIDGWQANQALPTSDPSFEWISVAKRFPVIITVTSPHDFNTEPFRIGASVILTIDTTKNINLPSQK